MDVKLRARSGIPIGMGWMDDGWVQLRDDLCPYWLEYAQSKPHRELKMGWFEASREKWEDVPGCLD